METILRLFKPGDLVSVRELSGPALKERCVGIVIGKSNEHDQNGWYEVIICEPDLKIEHIWNTWIKLIDDKENIQLDQREIIS